LADKGLLTGAETYARNTEEAVLAGVFGSPFYVVDTGQKFWGQDRLEDLELHLAGKDLTLPGVARLVGSEGAVCPRSAAGGHAGARGLSAPSRSPEDIFPRMKGDRGRDGGAL
jgi:hypothetical protein